MVDLIATSPLDGLMPVTAGALNLAEAAPKFITSVMPHTGKEKALGEALKKSHDLTLPAIGRTSTKAGLRMIWTGRAQYFLVGNKPAAKALAKHASLSDQSDGWAVMTLTGPDAAAVLARLCPVDLRETTFKRGHTARTEMAHMMVVVTAISGGFEVMVMRSFARTMAHHLGDAMRSVAAQVELSGKV